MFKILLCLNFIIFNILSKNNVEDLGKIVGDYNNKYKTEFESYVITYLKENYLYQNKVVIVDKKAFSSIFKAIMTSGESKGFEIFKKIYNKVCDEFIKELFSKKKKHIKATELDKIFTYENVMQKFNNYVEKNKINIDDL